MKRKLTGKLRIIQEKKPALFEEMNRKLVSWEYDAIAEWLFESGFKSLWENAADPMEACEAALIRYRGGHWQDWAKMEAERGQRFKTAEKQFTDAKALAKFSTGESRIGSAVHAKTLAIESLEQLLRDKADPKALSMAMRAVVAAIAAEQAEIGLSQKGLSLEQVNEKLRLDRLKIESAVLEKALTVAAQKRLAEIAASDLPRAEKIAAARQVYFADVDELEKAGGVKLPQ